MFLAVSEVVAAYHVVVQGCVGPSHVTHDQGAHDQAGAVALTVATCSCFRLCEESRNVQISFRTNVHFIQKKIMSHQCSLPQIHVKTRTFTQAKNSHKYTFAFTHHQQEQVSMTSRLRR